jgi:transposase-like protein
MLALSRDLGVQYKTAFVLAHKIRESIGATVETEQELSGEVEVDGASFGGHAKQENRKADRRDRRLAEERTGKRQVVVIIRERNGRAVPVVVARESAAVPVIRSRVASGSVLFGDESAAWDVLHGSKPQRRVRFGRWSLNELGRVVFRAAAARRDRTPSSHSRPLPRRLRP